MIFSIAKKFEFSASHQLDHLPLDHQCARLHGHNYTVIIELQGTLDERGFVLDYGELEPLRAMIKEKLDHRHLNDVLPCKTTAENIAKWLCDWCKARWSQQLKEVKIVRQSGVRQNPDGGAGGQRI